MHIYVYISIYLLQVYIHDACMQDIWMCVHTYTYTRMGARLLDACSTKTPYSSKMDFPKALNIKI